MSENIQMDERMRLGKIEFAFMNNLVRRFLQRHIEFRTYLSYLNKHNIDLEGKVIMDAGCGSGYSTELILNTFNPSKIIAFDYMTEQINLAAKRKLNINFTVGDITKIDYPNESCDAVFVFGVIHHIPIWKQALSELVRVLKPGGVLLIEEPKYGFTWEELKNGIIKSGFEILECKKIFIGLLQSYLCRKCS